MVVSPVFRRASRNAVHVTTDGRNGKCRSCHGAAPSVGEREANGGQEAKGGQAPFPEMERRGGRFFARSWDSGSVPRGRSRTHFLAFGESTRHRQPPTRGAGSSPPAPAAAAQQQPGGGAQQHH